MNAPAHGWQAICNRPDKQVRTAIMETARQWTNLCTMSSNIARTTTWPSRHHLELARRQYHTQRRMLKNRLAIHSSLQTSQSSSKVTQTVLSLVLASKPVFEKSSSSISSELSMRKDDPHYSGARCWSSCVRALAADELTHEMLAGGYQAKARMLQLFPPGRSCFCWRIAGQPANRLSLIEPSKLATNKLNTELYIAISR